MLKPGVAQVDTDLEAPAHDLAAKAHRGTYAVLASRIVVLVATIASITILARLISPADFGLWAVATLALGLVTIFRELGLTAVIVQAPSLTREQQDGYFWASLGISVLAAVALAAAAPLLARLYSAPALTSVLWTCCASLVLTGAGLVHLSLLRRRLEYNRVVIVEGGGMLCQLVVSVAAAYLWRNVWALVAAHVATALWMVLAAWFACRWVPRRPRARLAGINLSFSFQVTGYNVLTYLANNVGLIAGYRFPAADLGFFNRAQQFYNLTHFTFLLPMTEVAFSLLCRLRTAAAYREAYVALARRVWVFILPYAALLPIVAADIVRALLGDAWTSASPILAWFALAVVGQAGTSLCAQVMTSQGLGGKLRACAGADLLIRGAGALAGSAFGVVGVAAGFSLAMAFVSLPLMMWLAGRSGPVAVREQLAALWPGVLVAALAAASGAAAIGGANALALPAGWERLLFVGTSAGLTWAFLCLGLRSARDALLGRSTASV